jgi:hypothetical protein
MSLKPPEVRFAWYSPALTSVRSEITALRFAISQSFRSDPLGEEGKRQRAGWRDEHDRLMAGLIQWNDAPAPKDHKHDRRWFGFGDEQCSGLRPSG